MFSSKAEDATCVCCGRTSPYISRHLGVCKDCIKKEEAGARQALLRSREISRANYSTPKEPPRSRGGVTCRICANFCQMKQGEIGFCGLRENSGGRLHWRAGNSKLGLFTAYHDPLPTNCVADWVCPGCSNSGYPNYSYSKGAGVGFKNLAVFLGACSFDCAFCQNFSFRENTESLSPLGSPQELARMVDAETSCICFFGGDPAPQLPFAIAASRLSLEKAGKRILRICWETNGSENPALLKKAVRLSLESGGCIKFDLKVFDEKLHIALTGVSNKQTLKNIALAVEITKVRPEPPPVIVSTLMVPGYVDSKEVSDISSFLAKLEPKIPYALLAFHPDFLMQDMGTTTRKWAEDCYNAAKEAGLANVKIGNIHLLS